LVESPPPNEITNPLLLQKGTSSYLHKVAASKEEENGITMLSFYY
jgi:hypothetical protein